MAKSLVGNMYLGLIHMPRDDVSDVFSLICGYQGHRMHVIEECRSLEVDRSRLEEAVPAESKWDLSWLVWHAKGPFQFLLPLRDRFVEARQMGVSSTQA